VTHSHRSTVGSRVHHRLRHRFMTEIHCVHALGTSSLAKNGYAQSCTRDLYLGTPYNSGVFRTPCWGEVASELSGFFSPLQMRCTAGLDDRSSLFKSLWSLYSKACCCARSYICRKQRAYTGKNVYVRQCARVLSFGLDQIWPFRDLFRNKSFP